MKESIGSVEIFQGDVIKILPTLPDADFDALITDPPYSSGGKYRSDRQVKTSAKYIGGKGGAFKDFYGDNRDQRSYLTWSILWLLEAWRVLKPGALICIFTDWRQYPVMSDAIQAAGFVWRGSVVWDKTQGVRPNKGRFRQQAEFVLWGSKGPMLAPGKNSPVLPGVFSCMPQKGPRYHQVHKPENLMRDLIRIVPPKARILDPFMGSGTTLVESMRAGQAATGIELSRHYFDVAKSRLNAEFTSAEIESSLKQASKL